MTTILVVDDNFENRDVISRMLRIGGFHVINAANGREALETATEQQPQLILMDLAMPVMDGFTAMSHIRQHPNLSHIPTIAVTGQLTSDNIEQIMAAGFLDYLPKPIEFEDLLRKVRTAAG